ncbi:MAG TPA: DUF1992 domain-containing protein [Jatrophihabitans sp.]|nr:DUF1992 domain-containing protein [Jatrophihabitans sp.]
MTERKPRDMSVDDWVEGQIRRAEAGGAFEDLPGKGRPLTGLDRELDPMSWVVAKLRAENFDLLSVLPPQLALAREAELVPERVRTMRSENAVRDYLADLNQRIRLAHARPAEGPPMRVKMLAIDPVLAEWRAYRASLTPPPAPVQATRERRRLFRRRRREGGRAAG